MKKQITKVIAILLSISMGIGLVACGNTQTVKNLDGTNDYVVADKLSQEDVADDKGELLKVDEKNNKYIQLDENSSEISRVSDTDSKEDQTAHGKILADKNDSTASFQTIPKGEYNKGVVLVKVKDTLHKKAFGDIQYVSAEPLYKGSKWYSIELNKDADTEETVKYLTELQTFESVDYDYVMGVTEKETENPNYNQQTNLGLSNIPNGWTQNGKHPGGSSDVVVAVIDTGVDYNHLDLRNNIWTNTAEIAGNGKDDDSNGYIDDVYGWDCVGDDKDPIDDNGHGTHVAGIIAAENNKEGGIGVAYNCKIMVLKAGNSSGYFNNSDIAEAIQYAYMNGASVINMSFGGSQISIAVEEALEIAYNSCVLVAAAGNDGACNDLSCQTCDVKKVSYPAALPYVIGVMSTDKGGKHISSFSNYDHNPYDSIEYEVYAVGEGVGSTWPSNKYACLNGTSMAAPTVSGIAALLRSYYTDREVYSTKFIQSQIVNTGTVNPHILENETDVAHAVADVQEAMTKLPKPAVNLYDYRIDDSASINKKNNGNGVIDAGETVRLYFSLHNRGGVASNVNVSIDTNRGMGLVDPYFTFANSTMELSDIGTYSVRESGDNYFEIVVSDDCPNDYLADFNIHFTYTNGMDEKDKTVYEDDGKQWAQFNVSSGYYLPSQITEDTVFAADRRYIVSEDVVIPEGVTVTFEEGCEIQFYDDREYYNMPKLIVYGSLCMRGTETNMIHLFPNERHIDFLCPIQNSGTLEIDYVDSVGLIIGNINEQAETIVTNSLLLQQKGYGYNKGNIVTGFSSSPHVYVFGTSCGTTYASSYQYTFVNNYIELKYYNQAIAASIFRNNFVFVESRYSADLFITESSNNIFYTINQTDGSTGAVIEFLSKAKNEKFISASEHIEELVSIIFSSKIQIANLEFSDIYQKYASQIIDGYYDASGNPTVDVYGSCSDISLLWPYVVSVEMFNADGEGITTVGREEVKVRVTFNRPMDTTKDTYLTFGTIEPYADYRIDGEYVSDTVWEGTYTVKAQIENGQNFLKVNNACAVEDETKTVFGEYQLHEFTIDTTVAMSMNLQAIETDAGIQLTWAQDDYDTLMGYNIYRSDSKDGNYVKINPSILLSTEESFLDENAEPGKTYWYTFTVVLSDFTESAPAGKVMATAKDTQNPSLYHTPVNQGYENNNLVITCTASDNVAISNVTLYYRTVGNIEWRALSMVKQNDKYSATIYGSDVTMEGIEYYIVATDGLNTVAKGSEEAPYTVVVKSADTLTQMGDVDGNGAVSTKDALMLMQCINGDLLLSDDQFKRADLNKDGTLSSVEALRILQYINGKVTTLEM